MSLRASAWVWEQPFPPNVKLVLLTYADHAHDSGREARPTVALVARKTGFSTRQVQRIVAECVRLGALVLERQSTPGTPNVYRLPVDLPLVVPRDQWSTHGATPELRASLIEAFAATCAWCRRRGDEDLGLDPDGVSWEVDRVTPGRQGGTYAAANCVLSCRSCNRRRTSRGGDILSPPPGDILSPPPGDTGDAPPGDTGDAPPGDTGDALTIRRTVLGTVPKTPSPAEPVERPFDAFWATYPRREGKDAARRCWVRAVHRLRAAGLDAEAVILTGAARYRDDPNREAAYTAHAATWLHGGRWDDDPLPARGGANGHAAYSDPPAASYDDGWTLPPEGPTP